MKIPNTLKSFLGLFGSNYKPRPDEEGFIPITSIYGAAPSFNDYGETVKKIKTIFSNPACMKVFALQCDLFSLGKVSVYKNGKLISDPFDEMIKNPNPFQSKSQILWDYMFWLMTGTSYCYVDSKIPGPDNRIYFFDLSKMKFPDEVVKAQDKFVFANKTYKDILNTNITYRYSDGTEATFPLSKIIINTDLSNGIGNWFKGNSRIDALYKVITNSEESLDADNINIRYSGKFLVAGAQDPKDTTKLPLSAEATLDIETKLNRRKQVHAYKSMIEIKRFVEDLTKIDLGKKYLETYYLIGSMYNIPKDVLEAYNDKGSTFENQEKATARHVSYTLQPKGDDFVNALEKYFGYDLQGKDIRITWDHLPFMNVFEKDKAETRKTQVETMKELLSMGVSLDEVNSYLGTSFKNAAIQNKNT